MTVRAVRNSNPGNLRIGPHWQGLMARAQMTAEQAAETDFAVFAAPHWGFRALAIVLLNYIGSDGCKNAREIIHRYAPPGENDTAAYEKAFCKAVSVGPETPLDFAKPDLLEAACKAIAIHESGGWFFLDADLAAGVSMADAALTLKANIEGAGHGSH